MAAKYSRRNIIKLISITAVSVIGPLPTRPTSAQWLDATPYQPPGPFYHPFEPISIENDLLYNLDPQSRATGEVIYIRGRLTDQTGKPIKNTRIEIWQANACGRYNHPLQQNSKLPPDPNFLGFGHTLTGPGGH